MFPVAESYVMDCNRMNIFGMYDSIFIFLNRKFQEEYFHFWL